MADFDSSLPIRTQNAGDVAIKVVDSTITSQQLKVNADGSVNITDNGASLTVDATALDIRHLSSASDSVTANMHDGSGNALTSTTGKLDVNASGTVELGATSLAALESITVQNGAGASAVNIQDGGNSITVDATALDIRGLTFAGDKVDVSGSSVNATVTATALDIRHLTPATDSVKISDGTDSLAINADGSLNVVVTSSVAGTPVADYKDDSAIAGGASANHDYTVSALKQLKLIGILASASGKCKVEVQIETAALSGVFNTKFVGFNSTANPNIQLYPAADIMVPAGARVRVIKTNRDNQAQDIYSTIEGSEI